MVAAALGGFTLEWGGGYDGLSLSIPVAAGRFGAGVVRWMSRMSKPLAGGAAGADDRIGFFLR